MITLVLCLTLLLNLASSSEEWLSASGSDKNDRTRSYESQCSINLDTVSNLELLWQINLSGYIAATPTLDGEGGLYITSYGNVSAGTKGSVYKIDEDDGT